MRELSSVDTAISVQEYPGQCAIRVRFVGSPHPDWLIGLSLLDYELVDALSLFDSRSGLSVSLAKDNAKAVYRAAFSKRGNHFDIWVTDVELGAWMSFFLRYYRDGRAPVDHLDVDARSLDGKDADRTIVIQVDQFEPPVNAEDLKRFLQE